MNAIYPDSVNNYFPVIIGILDDIGVKQVRIRHEAFEYCFKLMTECQGLEYPDLQIIVNSFASGVETGYLIGNNQQQKEADPAPYSVWSLLCVN